MQNQSSRLPDFTRMGPVTLAVADLERSINFYTGPLGMTLLGTSGDTHTRASVGVAGRPLLHLQERRNARPQPNFSTGLYHVAILVPSRSDLGRVLINLARHDYRLQGASDHLVSEALYLADPDGNGLEIYRDRPRDQWRWQGDTVAMAVDPLDFEGVIRSAGDPNEPYTGMPERTTIGHVHLRVGDITVARQFYVDVLGFDAVATMPSALFVSAGRYHHHLGLNTWHSKGAPPPPEDSVGLLEYTIVVPDQAALDAVSDRLARAGLRYNARAGEVLVDDPWQNHIRLISETEAGG